MKKLVSVILAVMLLGTSFVFAEETVKNAAEDATLTANDCSDWAADDIAQAKEIGLLDDVSGLVYQKEITREKFCELIFDFIMITQGGITTSEYQNQFTDTDNRKVVVLRAAEIIYGKSDTEFAPNDSLTREEAATIIVRMINRVMPMPVTEMYFAYDDSDDIAEWASSAVQVMSNLGFMNGVGDHRFAPKDTYTAEQSIATLIRICKATRKTYEYVTPLGTITREKDAGGHINFAIEANARIVLRKELASQTQAVLPGPFRAFTNETSAMYITFDDFAKIFNGTWELKDNTFRFQYDASQNIVLSEYTKNETSDGGDWPNKTEAASVLQFDDMPSIVVNGEEKAIKSSYGGKVYDANIMMYKDELYIPVQMVAELLDYEIAVTDILWD